MRISDWSSDVCSSDLRQEADVITGFFTDICLMTELTEKLKLNLKRPIVFFDLKTTGVHVGVDRIVEYSFLKVMPDGTTMGLTRKVKDRKSTRLNSSH